MASHECLWNGPVWPYETSKVITGLIHLLDDYPMAAANVNITKVHLFNLISQYAHAQAQAVAINSTTWELSGLPGFWIGENLHPHEGYWVARQIMYDRKMKFRNRGAWYNHGTFVDLVLHGVLGIRVDPVSRLLYVEPKIPKGAMLDSFVVDNLHLMKHHICIVFCNSHKSKYCPEESSIGLRVYVDYQRVYPLKEKMNSFQL